jgi:hypothetical protein
MTEIKGFGIYKHKTTHEEVVMTSPDPNYQRISFDDAQPETLATIARNLLLNFDDLQVSELAYSFLNQIEHRNDCGLIMCNFIVAIASII